MRPAFIFGDSGCSKVRFDNVTNFAKEYKLYLVSNSKLIQFALDNENFQILQGMLASEREIDVCHSPIHMLEHRCLLPIPALGLQMSPNEIELEQIQAGCSCKQRRKEMPVL